MSPQPEKTILSNQKLKIMQKRRLRIRTRTAKQESQGREEKQTSVQ
jgi:hypothetical protein